MRRLVLALLLACLGCIAAACGDRAAAPAAPPAADAQAAEAKTPSTQRVWVALGGETFTLEIAADPETRMRGLSGRTRIERNGGMLFVFPRTAPRGMVMRDCPVPIDVAFLDAEGRVVAVSAMQPEPPRAPGEPRGVYEARLPVHGSGVAARFAVELAGGRLAALGIEPGAVIALDTEALAALAR